MGGGFLDGRRTIVERDVDYLQQSDLDVQALAEDGREAIKQFIKRLRRHCRSSKQTQNESFSWDTFEGMVLSQP